jgi:hypothetical protein
MQVEQDLGLKVLSVMKLRGLIRQLEAESDTDPELLGRVKAYQREYCLME